MAIDRIMVTPASQSHSELLTYWSKIEGRSVSSLCSSLIEQAIYEAIESGRANATAIKMMERVSKQRERSLQVTHQMNLKSESDKALDTVWSEYEKMGRNRNEEKSNQKYVASVNKWLSNEETIESWVKQEIENEDQKSQKGIPLLGRPMTQAVLGEFVDVIGQLVIPSNEKIKAFEMLKEFFINYRSDAIFDEERYENLIRKVNSEPNQSKRFDVLKEYVEQWEKEVPEDPEK